MFHTLFFQFERFETFQSNKLRGKIKLSRRKVVLGESFPSRGSIYWVERVCSKSKRNTERGRVRVEGCRVDTKDFGLILRWDHQKATEAFGFKYLKIIFAPMRRPRAGGTPLGGQEPRDGAPATSVSMKIQESWLAARLRSPRGWGKGAQVEAKGRLGTEWGEQGSWEQGGELWGCGEDNRVRHLVRRTPSRGGGGITWPGE